MSELDKLRNNLFNNLQYIEKLENENKQLKEDFAVLKKLQMISNDILNELEEYIKKHIEEWENDEDEYLNGVVAEDKDILQLIQELRNMYEKNE